jgi:hypothetical protein
MRQQHDEVDSIRFHVENLQLQAVPAPMEIEEVPSTSGSSPSIEQPPLDLNMPTLDNEMEEIGPSRPLSTR